MDFASALANLQKSAEEAKRDDRRRPRPPDDDPHHRRNTRPRCHNRDAPALSLDDMYRFGYRVTPYRPVPPPPATTRPKRHIAMLAITIDDLPYEHIWRAWSQQQQQQHTTTDQNNIQVSLLCHAKFPERVTSPWLKRRLLTKPPQLGRGTSFANPTYHTHTPGWGKVEITRAMIDLLATGMTIGTISPTAKDRREADVRFSSRRFWINGRASPAEEEGVLPTSDVAIPPVDKFIFMSETCLPVTTLEECVEALFRDEGAAVATNNSPVKEGDGGGIVAKLNGQAKNSSSLNEDATLASSSSASAAASSNNAWQLSWVNARNLDTPGTPRNKYERDQFTDIHRMIPQRYRWKADQWLVLSRTHAHAILQIDQHCSSQNQLWNSFANINASDEMYFPTALAVLNILREDDKDDNGPRQIVRRAVTYTDWSEGMRNPATYTAGMAEFQKIARRARREGCLLARKFAPALVVPGTEPTMTGQISVDEWKSVVQDFEADGVPA